MTSTSPSTTPGRPTLDDEALVAIDPIDVLEQPARNIHSALAEPGFTVPLLDCLLVYELDDPEQCDAILTRHDIKLSLSDTATLNRLAIHRDLRAPLLTISFDGTGSLCVLGHNDRASGSISLNDRCTVVVAGGESSRVMQMNWILHGRDQKIFWGSGSSAEGVHASVKGDGVAIVVGDDCMFSWRVWLRPSDMHLIVDLETERPINLAEDIVIEPHVWIGQEALILKGAHIGAGSIIGGRAVVPRGEYDQMSIYGGNPVRKLRENVSWDRDPTASPGALRRVRSVHKRYATPHVESRLSPQRSRLDRILAAVPIANRMAKRTRATARGLRDSLGRR